MKRSWSGKRVGISYMIWRHEPLPASDHNPSVAVPVAGDGAAQVRNFIRGLGTCRTHYGPRVRRALQDGGAGTHPADRLLDWTDTFLRKRHRRAQAGGCGGRGWRRPGIPRSEEDTSELPSTM